MDYAGFLRTIDRGQLPPVVLGHGADSQLLDDALAAATRALYPEASLVAFGREVLDAREADPDAVVRSAMTLPLMTSRRLVAVRHAEAFAAKSAAGLEAYLRDPNPSTCLLLLAGEPLEGGRDGRAHWLLRATPPSDVVTLPARQGRALDEWLRQRAAAEGLTVTEEASRLLVEWVGEDTAALVAETRKAALAAAPGSADVGVREVKAVVGEHRLAEVWDLTRAIERREAGNALRMLDRLLLSEEPMRLVAVLTGEVRQAWAVLELSRRGQSSDEIARTMRRSPRVIAARLTAVSGLSPATLASRLRRCWDVEWRLKSGGDAHAELSALVVELCGRADDRAPRRA